MFLTEKDIDLINQAEQAYSQSKSITGILIALLLTAIILFYFAFISSAVLTASCVALALLAIVLPRLRGPDYREMVALLVRVRAEGVSLSEDPVIDALTRK